MDLANLSKEQQAETVLAALDGRHQTKISCYCGGFIYIAPILDYQYCESQCLNCGRQWLRCGTESWSFWYMVDKRGRRHMGLRGREVFVPAH